MTGPLLARRPARAIVTAASVPMPERAAARRSRRGRSGGARRDARGRPCRARFHARLPAGRGVDGGAMGRRRAPAQGGRQRRRDRAIRARARAAARVRTGISSCGRRASRFRRRRGRARCVLGRARGGAGLCRRSHRGDARDARRWAITKQAVALGEAGRALAPGNAAVLRALGQAQLARRDGGAAAAAFAEALRIEPTDGETHFNHGVALQMTDDVAEAARAYQRALAFRPDLVAAHFNLGVLFQKQGVHEGAAEALRRRARRRIRATSPRGSIAARRSSRGARVDEFIAHFRQLRGAASEGAAARGAGDRGVPVPRRLQPARALPRRPCATTASSPATSSSSSTRWSSSSTCCCTSTSSPSSIHKLAQTYDVAARRVYGEPMPRAESRRPGPLRIGYLSADLRNHVMGKMVVVGGRAPRPRALRALLLFALARR